jgi:vacuolar-type H+-ATPase subunit C/Vma6
MKTPRVLFLIARTHGLQAHLLKTQDYVRLLGTRSVTEMSDLLMAGDYSTELSRIPTTELNALRLERVFYERLSHRWYSLLQITSGKLKELLEKNNERLEIENLKRIIRAVHGKASISGEQLIAVPRQYQELNFPALLAADTIAELVRLLKESPYKDMENRLGQYETYGNPALLEAQLDKMYYADLWSKANEASGSEETRALIGTEADLRNLQWIVSSKYMKVEPQLVHENLVDLGCRLRKSVISKLIDIDVQGMLQLPVPQPYSELLRKVVDLVELGKIVEAENLFSQHLYSYAEKVSVRNPNNLVYVFSYLQLCLREARNLTMLVIGKQMKMSENRLGSLLFI